MINFHIVKVSTFLWVMFLIFPLYVMAENQSVPFNRVLITNDNGIHDPKIRALAKVFSRHSETWVVAPMSNQSGSAHFFSIGEDGKLEANPVDFGNNIKAFAVNGKPADCVLLALAGIMKDQLPDLIISGINGGPNLADDWLYSGTIGAARIGALAGIPAIAVSGLSDKNPASVEAATQWVEKFARSKMAMQIQSGAYLTISIPRVSPGKILGIRVVDRSTISRVPIFDKVAGNNNEWQIISEKMIETQPEYPKDEEYYKQNYITIVPMHADEIDHTQLVRWQRHMPSIPQWHNE